MTTHDDPFPLFTAGTCALGGGGIACWVVDRHGCVMWPSSQEGMTTAIVGHRDDFGCRALLVGLPTGTASLGPDEVRAVLASPSEGWIVRLDADVACDPANSRERDLSELLYALRGFGLLGDPASKARSNLMTRLGRLRDRLSPGPDAGRVASRALADARDVVEGTNPFVATLDPLAVSWADHSVSVKRSDCEIPYVDTDPTFVGGGRLHAAWSAFPDLTGTATHMLLNAPDVLATASASGADALGAALRAHLVGAMGVPAAEAALALRAARTLDGFPYPDRTRFRVAFGSVPGADCVVRAAGLLHGLPASWTPRNAQGWVDLASCAAAVEYAVVHAGPVGARLMLNAKGNWGGLSRRLATAHGRGTCHLGLGQALVDAGDVTRALVDEVLAPLSARAGIRHDLPANRHVGDVAQAMTWSGRTVVRVLETSRRWHARRAAVQVPVMGTGAAPTAWEPCLPDASREGVSIAVLRDAASLVAEGARGTDADGRSGLSHCVGGYAGRCLSGQSRVLSLRASDGSRLSTAELAWRGGRPEVLQHRGRGNAVPPDAAAVALDAYVRDLRSGLLVASSPDLPVTFVGDGVAVRCGYDWRVPGAVEAALDAWRPWLTRTARAATVDDILVAMASPKGSRSRQWSPEGFGLPVPRPGATVASVPGP